PEEREAMDVAERCQLCADVIARTGVLIFAALEPGDVLNSVRYGLARARAGLVCMCCIAILCYRVLLAVCRAWRLKLTAEPLLSLDACCPLRGRAPGSEFELSYLRWRRTEARLPLPRD